MFFTQLLYSQGDTFKMFNNMVGSTWEGHYVDSEDSALTHYISWEYCLDSSYVKQIKEVPDVGFKMETYYYWDYENNQISSLSLLNKEMISVGVVKELNEKIVIFSKTYFPNGKNESKTVFEIDDNGILNDYFFRKKSDRWIRGHLIKYSVE